MRYFCALLLFPFLLFAQQVSDSSYTPPIAEPAFKHGEGPLLLLDEGHTNFHTINGRYMTFAKLLRGDGFRVSPHSGQFTPASLNGAAILVIANALNPINENTWVLPTPSAFTEEEIAVVQGWVSEGGSLFLIADHMPFPGAAAQLAQAFGFTMFNGFALDTLVSKGIDCFTLGNGSLVNPFAGKQGALQGIDSIWSFTGQAFTIPAGAASILTANKHFVLLMPDTAWQFTEATPRLPAAGFSQGAIAEYGKGRVAVWGEAAMFSAQLAGPNRNRVGMNAPFAANNYKLVLNLARWLAHKIE